MVEFFKARVIQRVSIFAFLLGLAGIGLWLAGEYALSEYHIRRARKELQLQRYDAALKEMEAALRLRPRNAELHLQAGRTARQAGKFSLAWDHLHRCRELQKGVSADLQLEEYLLRAQTGQLEEVFRFLLPYLHQDDENTALVLETLSHAYLFLFRFDNAWQCLQRWLQLQQNNVEALFLRGKYYTLVVKLESAIEDLQRVLELDPTRMDARLLLGQTLRQTHHGKKAEREFELALQQDPRNVEARLGLASCHADYAEWSQAEEVLKEMSPTDADNPELLYLRGRIAEGREHYEEAITFLRRAIAARPSDNIACSHLIKCYQHLGDEASAEKSEDLLYRIEKDQERLLAITNQEKERLATDPALCCELGEVCMRLGMKRRGLHWLQAALFLNSHYRRAHEQLLHYYEKLGPEGEEDASFHRRMLTP